MNSSAQPTTDSVKLARSVAARFRHLRSGRGAARWPWRSRLRTSARWTPTSGAGGCHIRTGRAPEPARKTGFDWNEYRRKYLGDHGPELPAPLTKHEVARIEARAAQLEAGRINMLTATPAQVEQRLRQLGMDEMAIQDSVRRQLC